MIAHANNSVAAGNDYGRGAEPRFWIDALRRWPTLRLCLAHGGGFCWRQTGPGSGAPDDRASWEWAIGNYIRENPASNLYMDISYFSEVMGQKDRRNWITAQLRDWLATCDREVRHLLFGTDWVMLGREPGYARYGLTVQDFLRDEICLTPEQLDRVMWGNAMRFLGLEPGQQTRERLLAFYDNRRPAWTELTPP
jgi:predicted TIM-barrel fold metal-dependent hydrolase